MHFERRLCQIWDSVCSIWTGSRLEYGNRCRVLELEPVDMENTLCIRWNGAKRPDLICVRYSCMKALYELFLPILFNLSSYGYSETTLSTKIFFSTYRCLFLLKLKVTKIPIQNGPFLAPWAAVFSWLEAIETKSTTFLNARDHDWLHGMNDFVSISSEKNPIFFIRPLSLSPP